MSGFPRDFTHRKIVLPPPMRPGPLNYPAKNPKDLDKKEPKQTKARGFWDRAWYDENPDDDNPESKGGRNHIYEKRSVKYLPRFCGWPTLLRLIESCDGNPYYMGDKALYFGDKVDVEEARARLRFRDKSLIANLFSGGYRIEECLSLRRSHFDLSNPKQIRMVEVPLLKRFTKTPLPPVILDIPATQVPTGKDAKRFHWSPQLGAWSRKHFRTEKTWATRTFRFPTSEPTSKYVLDWLEEGKDGEAFVGDDLIFQSNKVRKGEAQSMTQTSAYRIIRGVSIRAGINAGHKEVRGDVSGVWSHWARSMRASCLGSEYKWNKSQLDNWFGWEDLGATSKRYAHEDDEDQWAKMEAGAEHIKV